MNLPRRMLVAVACLFLAAAACGDDAASPVAEAPITAAATSSPTVPQAPAASEPQEPCAVQLETWHRLQQSYLDALGDATLEDFSPPPPELIAIGERLGYALFEVYREATQQGCAELLVEGTPQLCAQAARLVASGPVGEQVLTELVAGCA